VTNDHFVLKSRMEFERKRSRGRAMSRITEDQRSRDGDFHSRDRSEVSHVTPEPLVRQTKSEIERLLAMIR
jgi:hypothetical protein